MNERDALLIESNKPTSNGNGVSKRNVIVITSVVCIILAAIIIVTVVLTLPDDEEEAFVRESNEYYEEKFLEIPSNDSCYDYSQQFASKPHVAGMHQTLEIGGQFAKIMDDLGYESTRDDIENAVLDHYNSSQLFINDEEIDLSQAAIAGQPDTNISFRKRSWIAYSSSGDHTAPLLYVNGGSSDDYDYLINTLGIDLDNNGTGYIGLAKRGSRPAQAKEAGERGLKGLILFENNYRENEEDRYPNGAQMPNFGFRIDGRIRFGTGCTGNPSRDRLEEQCGFNVSEWDDLFPAIKYNLSMIQISPNTAIQLFEIMYNDFYNESKCLDIVDNSQWQTNLPTNACIGATDDIMAHLITDNDMHTDDTIQNVYGYMEGDTYPDEIVMLGAHRDAWGMGACDDISGTVTILEVARSLSALRDEYGWKPKRSIMFGSWDGEEWGLYGSTDFNEQDNDWIDKVVAYFNFDMTVVGGSLSIQGNPLLRNLLIESAQQIQYPYPDESQNNQNNSTDFTLLDSWWNFDDNAANNLPLIGCSSDFCAFEYYSGIATLGAGFTAGGNSYTYHTFYDLNGWLDIVDPNWKFAESIATYAGLLMLKFSQQDLIPFDVSRLAYKMNEWSENDLPNQANGVVNCSDFSNYIGSLIESTQSFQNATNKFMDYYDIIYDIINVNSTNSNNDDEDIKEDIRIINNILVQLTRKFKYDEGIPSNKWYKQLIWSVGGKRFPYIWDIINDGCDDDDLSNAFQVTIEAINEAADLLLSFEEEDER